MNTAKNIATSWLKRGAVATLVVSSVLFFNTLTVSASSSSSASSASSAASAGSSSAASSAASAASASSAASAAGSASAGGSSSAAGGSSSAASSASAAASAPVVNPVLPPINPPPYIVPYVPPHYSTSYHSYTSYGNSYNNSYSNLNATCVANQTSAYVGDQVYWTAMNVYGGNGLYTYSWSGTDGLYGYNSSAYMTYNTPGTKYAYMTVYSNGQSVTRTCSFYVNDRNNFFYPTIGYVSPQYPVSTSYNGVSLSQVPYTGLESNVKVALFTLALIAWSAIVTYAVILRRRSKLATAAVSTATLGTVAGSDEAEQAERHEMLTGHDNLIGNLENFARSQNVIISTDALAAIADASGYNQNKAETLLSSLANRHATGKDWTTIDLSKVQGAMS